MRIQHNCIKFLFQYKYITYFQIGVFYKFHGRTNTGSIKWKTLQSEIGNPEKHIKSYFLV